MGIDLHIGPDGCFDVSAGPIRLLACGPAFDGVRVAACSVEVVTEGAATTATYRLREGALRLRFEPRGETLAIAASLLDMPQAPQWVAPLHGGVEGAAGFLYHGLGFSGPSGIVDLARTDGLWQAQSYLLATLTGDAAACLYARDHRDFLQRTAIRNRQVRRGLIDRHLQRQSIEIDAGFGTEAVPTRGRLDLPELIVRCGDSIDAARAAALRDIAETMQARTHQPNRFHYCSWYERHAHFTSDDLADVLDGWKGIRPTLGWQTAQIDDGYEPAPGDWLLPGPRFPDGMRAAFDRIAAAGLAPGIWVAPFMVGSRSRLFAEHPDWVIHDRQGRPAPEWRHYDGGSVHEEHYALDASHPGVVEHLHHVFATLRGWGARYFKTDFLDWGLKDSPHVRRHDPSQTSVQAFRKAMGAVRQSIGQDAYLLACIAPYAPMIGLADGMRIANDVGSAWGDGGAGNMVAETAWVHGLNNVLWQNDPDVIYLRDRHVELSEHEVRSLALWCGIAGGVVATSDRAHRLPPHRLALLRFIEPGGDKWTARYPGWTTGAAGRIAVRDYDAPRAHAALLLNPTRAPMTLRAAMSELVAAPRAHVFTWGPQGAEPRGARDEIVVDLPPHGCELFYLSLDGAAPPSDLTLGGRRGA